MYLGGTIKTISKVLTRKTLSNMESQRLANDDLNYRTFRWEKAMQYLLKGSGEAGSVI